MVFDLFKSRRRARLRARPVPAAWRAILEHNLPIFKRLSAQDQAELLGHTQVFLAEKHFEGVGGLELTDEIRVTIAGQACLLLLHRDTDYYPNLVSIVVYPSGYTAHEDRHIGGGIWEEGGEDRLGHTGRRLGALVLAWDAVRRGAAAPDDGENLVLHEFAHQLDFENQSSDGTPALATRGDYLAWARVMSAEFNALRNAANAAESTVIDTYGTTNPSEFFAVITEAFFEQPRALRRKHPALFAQLQRFYRQDPTTYSAEPAMAD
ncbi:MAG TPA: M90 family metallopeptidase [Gemmatimonadaceae bacterium]|jgi:Mlc titration factor MtfA (ptsG expression regulator)|nr:M90 family metallopeptidase [Gemmatimonadaceae bacterium]